MESRIPLKLVLGGVRIVALSISSIKPSLLFSNIEGSVFTDYFENHFVSSFLVAPLDRLYCILGLQISNCRALLHM